MKKITFNRIKNKLWKKLQEEPQKRDPSLDIQTDKHAIDVACTEQNNRITVYKLH